MCFGTLIPPPSFSAGSYHPSRKTISNMTSVAEIQTFHSSQCICDLGVKDAALCKFPSCGICRIVKTSFKELAFGERYNTGRWVHIWVLQMRLSLNELAQMGRWNLLLQEPKPGRPIRNIVHFFSLPCDDYVRCHHPD